MFFCNIHHALILSSSLLYQANYLCFETENLYEDEYKCTAVTLVLKSVEHLLSCNLISSAVGARAGPSANWLIFHFVCLSASTIAESSRK